MDWNKAKKAYISGNKSYRQLAEKFGCSESTMRQRAAKEKWGQLRNEYRTKAGQKFMDAATTREAARALRVAGLGDQLLDQLEIAIDELKVGNERIDRGGIKQITSALKDIKDLLNIRTEMDKKEQQARIDNLHKQSESGDLPATVKVVLSDEVSRYAE